MNQVWKFPIPPEGNLATMPEGAEVLAVGLQGQEIMVWAKVDPKAPIVARRFPVYGTGHEIKVHDAELPFVGTVFMGPLVWHVFDGGET